VLYHKALRFFIADCQLPIADCQLPIADYRLTQLPVSEIKQPPKRQDSPSSQRNTWQYRITSRQEISSEVSLGDLGVAWRLGG
jgi:hypothetical protein